MKTLDNSNSGTGTGRYEKLGTRTESDTMGVIQVPSNRYWGAETQRSLENFKIGTDPMPKPVIRALVLVKKTAALVNTDLGKLPPALLLPILKACDEILAGKMSKDFPLLVWQTGSGTQSNMNVNEVIANRATEILVGTTGHLKSIHPNDHVNLGQSSNDSFPTAMHIAAVEQLGGFLLPALKHFHAALLEKENNFKAIIKIGRTHLMDATPMTLGQEFSGYRAQIGHAILRIEQSLGQLHCIAQGGTAVGTGLNTHPEFAERFAARLSELTKKQFFSAANKFEALACNDALVFAHGALKTLAASLMKIANDLRWMGSGPNAGLHELQLPENEPGSSMMPGKVNPTQCESMTMVCCQIFGNDVAINWGGASGQFELNVYRPMIIYNFLHSVRLLTDSLQSFNRHCLKGIRVNESVLHRNVDLNLMRVTALVPHLGYEKAAKIAKKASADSISLKKASLDLGFLSEAEFDNWADPSDMLSPKL